MLRHTSDTNDNNNDKHPQIMCGMLTWIQTDAEEEEEDVYYCIGDMQST